MIALLYLFSMLSIVSSGAIFGFFYAWICSTMWGLDAADPRTAIGAMQAMNASVRNIVFAPAFFGTAPLLGLTALLAWTCRVRRSAILLAMAGLLYLLGGMVLTMTINVPMNQALAAASIPTDLDAARLLWQNYSQPWQFWNMVRASASGATLALVGAAILSMRVPKAQFQS